MSNHADLDVDGRCSMRHKNGLEFFHSQIKDSFHVTARGMVQKSVGDV